MNTKKRKGVALIWTMLTSAVLLLMATIIANVIIKEIHMVTNFTLSSQAINAAEAGINYGKWCLDSQDTNDPCNVNDFGQITCDIPGEDHCHTYQVNVGSGTVDNSVQIKQEGADYRINSWGVSGHVTRKLSYLYSGEKNVDPLNEGSINSTTFNYPSSFSLSFDFWTDPDVSTTTNGNVLLANFYNAASGAGTKNIAISYNSQLDRSVCLDGSGVGPTIVVSSASASGVRCLPLTNQLNTPYSGTIFIRYIKNVNAIVTYKQRISMVQEACTVSKQLDLTALSNTNFNKIAVNGAVTSIQNFSGNLFKISPGGALSSGAIYLDNFKPYQ